MWLLWKNLPEIVNTAIKIGLYGASGHAKVIADMALLNEYEIGAIFDDNPAVVELLGRPVQHILTDELKELRWILSIGYNHIRHKLVQKHTLQYTKIAHPRAILASTVQWGEGTVIMAGAVVNPDTRIGRHVIINTSASVDHDCTIGDFCHIAPNSTLCGGITVGEGTLVGSGAVITPGITIGNWCTIGAGAVVVRNVPDGQTVVGNPAKVK